MVMKQEEIRNALSENISWADIQKHVQGFVVFLKDVWRKNPDLAKQTVEDINNLFSEFLGNTQKKAPSKPSK